MLSATDSGRVPLRPGTRAVVRVITHTVYGMLGIIVAYPLLLVEGVGLAAIGWTNIWLLLLPLAVIASWAVVTLALSSGEIVQFLQIRGHIARFRNCTFTDIPAREYFGGLTDAVENGLIQTLLRGDIDKVKVWLIEPNAENGGPVPFEPFLTFPGPSRTVIFVRDRPHSVRGPLRFVLLHELGHASLGGSGGTIMSHAEGKTALLCVPMLALKVQHGLLAVSLLAALGASAMHYVRSAPAERRRVRLFEEVAADTLALERSEADAEWLKTPERLLQVMADRDLTPQEATVRSGAFIENARRRREHRALLSPSKVIPDVPNDGARRGGLFFEMNLREFVIPVLLVMVGLTYAPPTTLRVGLLAALVVCYAALALAVQVFLIADDKRLDELVAGGCRGSALETLPLTGLILSRLRQRAVSGPRSG